MGRDYTELWVKVLVSLILGLIWGALSTLIDPSLFPFVAGATVILSYTALAICGGADGVD